jgi:hypothetical protein
VAYVSALVRFNGIVEQLRDWRGRERLLRRALGLPGEAPEPSDHEFVREGVDRVPVADLEPGDVQRRRTAWDAEDWRADIALALARLPISITLLKDTALGEVEVARGKRALASARTLRYTSTSVIPTRGCTDIDGYFDLGPGRTFHLSLVATGAVNDEALRAWEDGELLDDDGLENLLGGRHILIPGDEVTPELAAEALGRWYQDRFESKRRHWTHQTATEPTIVLDLNWADSPLDADMRLGQLHEPPKLPGSN